MKTGRAERAIVACCGSRRLRRQEWRIRSLTGRRSARTPSTWKRAKIEDNRAHPASQAGQGTPRQKEKKYEEIFEVDDVCCAARWRVGDGSRAARRCTEWIDRRHDFGYQWKAVVWAERGGRERPRREVGCEDGCGRKVCHPQSSTWRL